MKELMDALDELVRVIMQQTAALVSQAKDTVRVVAEGVRYRHGRAKGKARQLRAMSGQFMSYASEKFSRRAEKAKKRAHKLRETYGINIKTDWPELWAAYKKAQAKSVINVPERSGEKLTEKVKKLFAAVA